MKEPLYRRIASTLAAIENCKNFGDNQLWLNRHQARLDYWVKKYMPSGSGIDNGTRLGAISRPDRLVFETSVHHMDDVGSYDGWTEHNVVITPSLVSKFDVRVMGVNRNQIKDYLTDVFDEALKQLIDVTDVPKEEMETNDTA
jgi:hypothetical protein